MEHNSPYLPALALVAALVLFAGVHVTVRPALSAPVALSSMQIFMVVLTIVFFVYGAIGTVSVWLEGRELRIRRAPARPGRAAVAGGVVGSIVLVVLAGFFGRLIWSEAPGGPQDTFVQGSLAAGIFFVSAALVLLLRRAAIPDEVTTEDEHTEVPW